MGESNNSYDNSISRVYQSISIGCYRSLGQCEAPMARILILDQNSDGNIPISLVSIATLIDFAKCI